ncbi:hypothetical protein LCGC14_0351630 [marine sediment metagenome]|uniref:Uncharacterized protein n=1 Tax=marine sediment metagenome TaxID=412755 RepID=A0A0F9TGD8_9ZZZZ
MSRFHTPNMMKLHRLPKKKAVQVKKDEVEPFCPLLAFP